MDITPYIEGIRQDLLAAARAAGEDGEKFVAERLSYAMDASARLAIMEAVSAAAAEITAKMPSGSVDVKLVGRDLDFAINAPLPSPPTPPSPPHLDKDAEPEDEGGLARVTVRLPEAVKAKAEARAEAANQSLNTWIVNAIRVSTIKDGFQMDPSELINHFLGQDPFTGRKGSRHMKGWN